MVEDAGFVESKRLGRETRFTFLPKPLEETKDHLDEVAKQWEDALGRLKAFVEEKR